jgi:hypothetical protein
MTIENIVYLIVGMGLGVALNFAFHAIMDRNYQLPKAP